VVEASDSEIEVEVVVVVVEEVVVEVVVENSVDKIEVEDSVDKIEEVEVPVDFVVEISVRRIFQMNFISISIGFGLERETVSDSVYVGQLPADIQESDLKKLFPKATKVSLTEAQGPRPG
jgi:hypothetical protein